MKNFFEKLLKQTLARTTKTLVKKVIKRIEKKTPEQTDTKEKIKPHPWRQCSVGEHWVVAHQMKVPISNKNPNGFTIRKEHCALNPDSLGFEEGNKYDHFIGGWTKYWNDVFEPTVPLDPNLVKALIGSESGFTANPKLQNAGVAGKARGLIQLTDQAVKTLSVPNNEIKDHYVKISLQDTEEPNRSIAAGIRWLFHKKRLASGKLGREATWEEAIAEYKAYSKKMIAGKHMQENGMIVIYNLYERLQK